MKIITLCIKLLMLGAFISSMSIKALAADQAIMTYDAGSSDVTPIQSTSACAINFMTISDQRPQKEALGNDFKSMMSGDNVTWLSEGFDTLKAYGFTVQRNVKPVTGAINLEAKLIRAYTWHGGMRINGVVAIDLSIAQEDGTQSIQKFRASGSKSNMVGATSEYVTALNYSLNNLLSKMAVGLQQKCSPSKI